MKTNGINLVLLLDWIMCILLGILALLGMILIFMVNDDQVLIGSTFVLTFLSLVYSPLIKKNFLIRTVLFIVTVSLVAY